MDCWYKALLAESLILCRRSPDILQYSYVPDESSYCTELVATVQYKYRYCTDDSADAVRNEILNRTQIVPKYATPGCGLPIYRYQKGNAWPSYAWLGI